MQSPTSGPSVAPSERTRILPTIGGKYFALAVLFSMNLLNYVDRYTFFAVGKNIQEELHISDRDFGWLASSFLIVYTIISPLIGWLGDRYNRRFLLTFGVGLWSLATIGTAFSHDFWHLFFWRALLGVGEASYGVIAPPLLSDLFEPKHRGRVMGVYFLALPLGGALGYAIGGSVVYHWPWQAAFWVVGLPGLLAAAAALVILDPGRGASEGHKASKAERPKLRDYLELFRTPSFIFNTAGMAAVTYGTGAYAVWGSTFYQTAKGLNARQDAGIWIGGLTAGAGLLGIAAGTGLADFLLKFTSRAYLLMASVAVVIAIPFGALGILNPQPVPSLGLLFVAMILMASVLGPCNTVTANVVPAPKRAAGYAPNIFLIHLFGDISSPIVVGYLSDFFGKPGVAQSWLGQFFAALGATPVGKTNLTVGMLSVFPVLLLGCLFFLFGSRHLEEDQEKARQHGPAPAEGMAFH